MEYSCVVCNKVVELKNPRRTDGPYRCPRCVARDPDRIAKLKEGQKRIDWVDRNEKIRKTSIERYGVTYPSMLEEIKDKAKQTSIERYGVDNPSKSKEIIEKIKTVSMERYGVDNPAKAEINRKKISDGLKNSDFDRVKFSKDRIISMSESGIDMMGAVSREKCIQTNLLKYNNEYFFGSETGRMTKEVLIDKYGWSEEKYEKLIDTKRQTLENFIIRYGEVEGTSRYENWKLMCVQTLENFISRHGEVDGRLKYEEFSKKRLTSNPFGTASKESIRFFLPIYRKIRRLGVSREDIYFGISGSKEFYISVSDNHKTKFKLYDFTIRSLKIIIEYHGIIWHAKENLSEEQRKNFKTPYGSMSYEEVLKRDNEKKKIATSSGFEYIVVWSDDNLKEKEEEIVRYIGDRLKCRS